VFECQLRLRTKTCRKVVSVNVTILKLGLICAIFFSHSSHEPHGPLGFKFVLLFMFEILICLINNGELQREFFFSFI